jgi:hypothetical protein
MIEDIYVLKKSTANCDIGPEIEFKPGLLTVRYDSENDLGVDWTTVTFNGVIAVKITPEYASETYAVRAYSKICKLRNSEWLSSLLKASDGNISLQKLNHYVVYFDHFGSIEIIALSFSADDQDTVR